MELWFLLQPVPVGARQLSERRAASSLCAFILKPPSDQLVMIVEPRYMSHPTGLRSAKGRHLNQRERERSRVPGLNEA